MEYVSVLTNTDSNIGKNVRTNIKRNNLSNIKTNINHPINNKIVEGDENFLDYLNWQGLASEDNFLVLSSKFHYYYDYEELKDVKILISLKKLNLIKHLDDYLNTLNNGLSPKTNFIGCFSDCKTKNGNSFSSRIFEKIVNFLDSRVNIEIDKDEISRLLESVGFKVLNMTVINGLTYFLTQS
jgi:hypothetical protein